MATTEVCFTMLMIMTSSKCLKILLGNCLTYILILAANSLVFHCGDERFCKGEIFNNTCRTTDRFLVWKVTNEHGTRVLVDYGFGIRDLVGVSESIPYDGDGNRFILEFVSKTNDTLVSNIIFSTETSLNNSIVFCEGGFSGVKKNCSIRLFRECFL